MEAGKDISKFSPSINWTFWISDIILTKDRYWGIFITNGFINLSLPVFHKIEVNLQKRTFPLWFSRFVSYSGRANWQIISNSLIYTTFCHFVKFYFPFSQKIINNVKTMAGNKNCRRTYLSYLAIVTWWINLLRN